MRILGWTLAALLGSASLACIGGNYWLMWRDFRAKPGEKVPSMVPFAGGFFGYFALRLAVILRFGLHSPRASWAWLAPLVDPGCYAVYLLVLPIAIVLGLRRRGAS